jgi:solute carrier family 35 protein C2
VPSTSSLSLDDLHAPDAVAALAGVQGSDLDMEPSSSGHRRRRSSLMNSLDASAHAKSKSKRSNKLPGDGNRIQEEIKRSGADDDLSTSDDVELSAMSDDEGLQDDEETGLTGKDKQKRKRRRRRNTLLDHRIAGEGQITHDEKQEATKSVVKNSLINVCLIGMWYLFSLSISMVSPLFMNFALYLTDL